MTQNVNVFQSFLLILVCQKQFSLQVYLDNSAYKIANKQMTDYLDENVFEN